MRRYKNKYTNYSFERSIISFQSSCSKISEELISENYVKENENFSC